MKCPCCNGKRFIIGFEGRDECYLCRSLGVVTPEAQRQWAAEQDAERIRQIRAELAREAAESTQWEQLAFAWDDEPPKVNLEKRKKVGCAIPNPLPSTTGHQPSLALEIPSEIIPDGQHGTYADQHVSV